jgi:hypothetical protein
VCIYIYIYVCAFVCARAAWKDTKDPMWIHVSTLFHDVYNTYIVKKTYMAHGYYKVA